MAFRLSRWFCVGLAVAIATAASGCSKSGSKSSPTATDEQPMVAPTLAPAPTSCAGPKPHREKVSPDLAPLAGQRPVWAGFYAPLDVKSGALHLPTDTPRTSNGWRIKTLWAVAEDQQGLVKVRGDDIKTGAVVRFKVGEAAISTTGVLDPRKPGTVTAAGEPREFPSYLYFAASGCYELHASWPGGGWKMVLGFGR